MQHVRRVALIYDARSAYDVKVMTGVASYVQQSMKWSVYLLGFLAGYGVEAVFRMLDGLADQFSPERK